MAETRSSGSQIYLKVQPGRGLSEGSRNHSQYKGSSHQRNSQRRHLGFHHCGPGVLGRRHLSDRGSAFSRPLLFAAQHGQLLGTCTATATASRIAELCSTESMRGRGRRVHRRRAVPSAAHRVRGAVLGSCSARGLPPRPLPPRPAPLLRPRAASAYTRTAFLPLRRPRVRRAPAPDLRALLRFLRAWPGATFLPRALRRLRAQPDLQVSCATTASNPDGCLQDQAPSCLRAYAGLVGTAITPNYVDNASARVEPWCDCRASGNRREECEVFRGLFTRNRCLDSAIQTFDGGWPPILRNQLDSHQDPGQSLLQVSSADVPLEGSSLLSMLLVLALQSLF
ncbi:GDNF family receptor alpha-4 isoform X2 [Ovis aries]|uniref:GDNF family receptor alpha-4 isoform X2 n=1 Tax=Ovis aries TaxID=9940 RepID=UPI001C2EF1FC|nr:GDNF family receptor alpha-4 isoform X2 [Ovis aries]